MGARRHTPPALRLRRSWSVLRLEWNERSDALIGLVERGHVATERVRDGGDDSAE